jgi:hypothetical protein
MGAVATRANGLTCSFRGPLNEGGGHRLPRSGPIPPPPVRSPAKVCCFSVQATIWRHFSKDRFDVQLHSCLGQTEFSCDPAVLSPLHQAGQYFSLSTGQLARTCSSGSRRARGFRSKSAHAFHPRLLFVLSCLLSGFRVRAESLTPVWSSRF